MIEKSDGVAFSVDGGAFSEPREVARFFCVGIGSGEDVGCCGGVDAHGRAELEAGVFGIAVKFGVTGYCGDDGGFIDLNVAMFCGEGDGEGTVFFEEGCAFVGFPEDTSLECRVGIGGVLREEFFVDLVTTFHVPPVEGAWDAVDGDFAPTNVDASVVGEATTGTFCDGGGAFGVHDVEEGFVGFVKTFGRRFVVGVLVSGEGFAFVDDIEMVSGSVGEREIGGVGVGEAEE